MSVSPSPAPSRTGPAPSTARFTTAAAGQHTRADTSLATRASHHRGFWFAAVAFTVLMAFGTAPTPLWPLYAARDGFGTTTMTIAFTGMVAGAAVSFLTLGHLSDRFGRRRIIVPALVVGLVAAVVLIAWPTLPGLLTGRVLNGIGVGLMASTATTYLHDLYREAHPERRFSALPATVATAANLGGLALGPLVAGSMAQWAPSPLVTTQAVFAAAMAVSLVLVLSSPETVDRQLQEKRPSRFALLPGARRVFTAAAAMGFVSFALLGFVSSLGATLIHDRLHIDSHLITGLTPFLMFASAALAQLAAGRLGLPRTLRTGAVVFPIGLTLTALSLYHPALWLLLIAVSVAGAGAGLLFKSGVTIGATVAEPASRAGVLSVYFVIGYIGMGVPSILFTIATQHIGLGSAVIGLASVLAVGAALSVALATSARQSIRH
ncbi:MFS transporter [Streptomyces sp. NPDC056500]|uniref:MFS transporter n=1 Tax=Streptomyces sp. NPDC056500 TaxID=3345840 RepID=UPI0036A7A6D5